MLAIQIQALAGEVLDTSKTEQNTIEPSATLLCAVVSSGPPPGVNTLVVSGPTGSTTVLLSCYLQVSQWLYDHQSNQPTIVTTIPSSALQTVPNHPEHFQDELLGSAYKKMYAHCVTGAENRWGDHRARARIYVRLNR